MDGNFTTSLGVQPVQVLPPTIENIQADIGTRLLPNDHYYGVDDLIPDVTAGGGSENRVLVMKSDGPKYNWVYGIKKTIDEPWNVEIYWQHLDSRGVAWPFEVDWYHLDWPVDAIRVVLGDDPATDTPAVLLPTSLPAQLANKEPANVANISDDGRTFSFSAEGYALVQYNSSDNIWFDALRAVKHNDPHEYDQTASPWLIGEELLPYARQNHALYFDGNGAYVEASLDASFHGASGVTVEAWAYRTRRLDRQEGPVVSHTAGPEAASPKDWELGFGSAASVYFRTHAGTASYTLPLGADLHQWHHLAGVYDGERILLYVDGILRTTLAATSTVSTLERPLLLAHSTATDAYFAGRIDEVRLWNVARDAAEIQRDMRTPVKEGADGLAAAFNLDEGKGHLIRNWLTGGYGRFHGRPVWLSTFQLENSGGGVSVEFPGYLYSGPAYNVNRYRYPTVAEPSRESYLFAVNTNQMEVWWAQPSSNPDLPEEVYYPSLVQRYDVRWPAETQEIVIASGQGSGTNAMYVPSLYIQNDKTRPGYNPNEEHAVMWNGRAYALRNDLNTPGGASEPFVLVDDVRPETGRPLMWVYRVVQTNEQYGFRYAVKAGGVISPPMPLEAYPGCENTTAAWGPAWEDRKQDWWAKAAGNDGGATNAGMRFYYAMQDAFAFPALSSPPATGTELPWLPTTYTAGGSQGIPQDVVYDITWPQTVPELYIVQTLTTASGGLPDIWNQLSVELVYEQAQTNGYGKSVDLFDPVVAHAADLDFSVIQELEALQLARRDWTGPRYVFDGVSPSLRSRLYFDPDRGSGGQLVLIGELYTPLTGTPYVLPNWLEGQDLLEVQNMGTNLSQAAQATWMAALGRLPTEPTRIVPDQAIAGAALSSAISAQSNAVGYVTLAFNNNRDPQQVPPALPVSLSILKVVPELFSSQYLDVIESDNALDEKLSLRYPLDFGGQSARYEFEWRWADPEAGGVPSTPYEQWTPYGSGTTNGAPGVNIEGGGQFMLSDHYFAVRYRRADGLGPTGTNWSRWVSNLAPGWIQRVMNGINPYEQRLQDMVNHSPGLVVSMISQAGAPYEGPVALNAEAADSAGLIQIYQTVLERALSLTLTAGLDDSNSNDSLLFAASRLCDLYMLLGNEAYADAMDPTIGFGTDTGWFEHYGAMASSLFSFMNQMPNLLEEELALLRGRDASTQPGVTLTPVFNRLMWNYTRGIDGGEVAYAASYNIKGNPTNTTGIISAEDAKGAYPQGHGDAWGHYLSALDGFYRLLAYPDFGWNTIPGATMVGNAAVSSDFFDEQKFAEAAAAKARTGAEILSRTYRRDYQMQGVDAATWTFYNDSDTNRQWGVDGWASRAGQGAYFDWVVGNSLLIDAVTNLTQLGGADHPAEGLYIIDRRTVPELDEITVTLQDIQTQLDQVDLGLSPLGLDKDAIPFDISATEIDNGKTHFEQVYERALSALQNAHTAFAFAQGCTQRLREQSDSVTDFTAIAAESDISYNNQLIEIFGYPFTDDVGVGKTYPQGYDGPDLMNYQILDLDDSLGLAPVGGVRVTSRVYAVSFNADGSYGWTTNNPVTITTYINEQGLQIKDPAWTGRRPAEGQVQAALTDFAAAYYDFLRSSDEYSGKMVELNAAYAAFNALKTQNEFEIDKQESIDYYHKAINNTKIALEAAERIAKITAEIEKEVSSAAAEAIPTVVGTVLGGILSRAPEAGVKVGSKTVWGIAMVSAETLAYASEAAVTGMKNTILSLEHAITTNALAGTIVAAARDLTTKLNEQYVARDELLAKMTTMAAAEQAYFTVLKKGDRLMSERARERSRVAQRIQQDRYTDMLFRIFRDEALRKYNALFELAARYVYLAAKAYDYETGLLNPAATHSAASHYLTQIAKARSLGRIQDGQPLTAGSQGDPGLADALARMKADWDVVKSRMGFNNPETETSRLSLRQELLRIAPAAASDETWRNALETYRVDNLYDLPEFKEYCVPFSSTTNREPGLVIPFSSWILPGMNYFGRPLAGGDNAYDATHIATKIRSVGIWFTGYNTAFNTNQTSGAGLANEPRIYLVPVGNDLMRTPARDRRGIRSWQVFDQALPLPYNIGRADLNKPDWIPLFDSLSGSFAQRRRHASMRAYHDSGEFNEADLCSNSRLVGRSVWNTKWLLIIPGRTLLSDADEAMERFIYGTVRADGSRDGAGVTDIKLLFKTYSHPGD
ncbi:MAG: LamG domain-containing protein [Verrucomicrobiota bacterium]|nr:LamG domain-containing protein [Verrucomicrobiota bacterium]